MQVGEENKKPLYCRQQYGWTTAFPPQLLSICVIRSMMRYVGAQLRGGRRFGGVVVGTAASHRQPPSFLAFGFHFPAVVGE